MPQVNFNYFALHYLKLWLTKDRKWCEVLAGDHEDKKLAALAEAAVHYSVARNLPKAFDFEKGIPRYKPVLDAIDNLDPITFQGDRLIPSIVEVGSQISETYGGQDLISLTTKFLWLKMKSPVVIYDARAMKALSAKRKDIEDYYSRWRKQFASHGNEINAACELLPKAHKYSAPNAATPQYIEGIASQPWFKERVFDVYLWDLGGQ